MKKAVLSFVVILFACTLVVSAQPAGKKFELGFSGSFTSFKFSYESDSTTVLISLSGLVTISGKDWRLNPN